jgi:hypothetical protein
VTTTVHRKDARRSKIAKIPGISSLAEIIQRIARIRHGRVPTGLIMLLPLSLFIDIVDSPIDLLGGPFSMGIAFILETAFMLGLTGQTSWALLFSGIDLIPGLDLIPFATLTLIKEINKAWREGDFRAPVHLDGAVIDV